MTSSYKTLLGLANVDADVIEAEMISTVELKAENADINNAIINNLTIPNGLDSYILTSNANSLASCIWKPNILSGEVSGLASDTKLTIPNGQDGFILTSDNNSLPSWKFNQSQWVGNWNGETAYKKNNLVTHNHTLYRALVNNVNTDPEAILEPITYNLYTEPNYSSPPYIQDTNNKYGGYWIGLRFVTKIDYVLTGCQYPQIPNWDRFLPFYYVRVYENGVVILTHNIPKSEMVWDGWQRITFVEPINIVAGNTYEVAYEPSLGVAYQVGNQMNYVDPDVAPIFSLLTNVNRIGTHDFEQFVNEAYLMDVFLEIVPKYWEVVLDDRPDTVYETKAQSITNKINIETQIATVSDQLILPNLFHITSENYNLKYLVLTEDNYTRRVTDLYAPTIGASNAFKFKFGAGANKVLTCIDDSGLTEWRDLLQVESVLMTGDVTGQSNSNIINTLANGTIQVSDLVTTSSFNSLLPSLGGDVTGPYGATVVNTLANGSISVYNLLTTSGSQYVFNKLLNATNAFIGSNNSRLIFGLEETSFGTTTQLKLKSTISRVIYLPDVDDTLIGKNTYDYLMNKTLNDSSNNVFANGLRNGNSWNVSLSGSAPTQGMILAYTGSTAIWSLPTFSGDVTGGLNSTVVNTLAGGTIPVNQLVTITDPQILKNKNFEGLMYFSDLTRTKLFSIRLDNITTSSITNLMPTSTADQTIYLPNVPNSTDTLVGKNTTDIMKNKTITDVSNVVYANGIRNGSTWVSTFSGAAPTTNQILTYNGTNAVWSTASPLVTLDGDVTGPANNNVVSKATTDFAVGRRGVGDMTVARILSTGNVVRTKKITVYDEGVLTDPNDHRFMGLGVQAFQMRYQTPTTGHDHVFYAATSATASTEVFRVTGAGNVLSNAKISSATSQAWSWINPTNQGAYTGWNKESGSGRTTFANQMGGGYGGWNWINYNSVNVQTPSGDPAMSLDRDGNLTVRGNLTVNGNMGQDETITNGYWRSSNGTQKQTSIRVIKTGKLINLSVPSWDTTTPSSGYVQWTNMTGTQLTLPAWAIPSSMTSSLYNYHHPMTLTDQNYNRVSGTFEITYDGKLLISPNVGASLINRAGWNPFSITYPVD